MAVTSLSSGVLTLNDIQLRPIGNSSGNILTSNGIQYRTYDQNGDFTPSPSGTWVGFYCQYTHFYGNSGVQIRYSGSKGTKFTVHYNRHNDSDWGGGGGIFIRVS